MRIFHGTLEETLELADGVLDFCLTEDFDAAEEYATDHGCDGFVHEYRFSGKIADEETVRELLGFDEFRSVVEPLDQSAYRQQIRDAGYDACEFEDHTNGGTRITTLRVFMSSSLTFVETHAAEF